MDFNSFIICSSAIAVAVSKYETGRVPLSEEAIEKICQFLNVSWHYGLVKIKKEI